MSELAEEKDRDDEAPTEPGTEWRSPLRESALREILAHDLSQLEQGMVPFDPQKGAGVPSWCSGADRPFSPRQVWEPRCGGTEEGLILGCGHRPACALPRVRD